MHQKLRADRFEALSTDNKSTYSLPVRDDLANDSMDGSMHPPRADTLKRNSNKHNQNSKSHLQQHLKITFDDI